MTGRPSTGQTISHYRILDKLGEGGMGAVYKAEDTHLNRLVALKFITSPDAEARTRFLREARAAAAINHPNVATIYEVDEQHGFLAMELVDGETLRDKIARRPLPLSEAIETAIQAAEGLEAAHGKAIVHRDVKPANILLTSQGRVKITDFGLAAAVGATRITKSGTSVGTPPYMSPEQTQGQVTDSRTDIWSLGVVLYEMVAGRLPFEGEVDAAITYGIVNKDPEPLTALRANLPTDIDRIVAKALAKDPRERYQHAADLRVDLERLRAPASTARVSAPRRHRRRWIPVAAACVILAAGLWWFPSRRSSTPGEVSIAVLPLSDLTPNPSAGYLADAITETLISELSRIRQLRVVSKTTAMRFKEANRSLAQVARDLNVSHVVEGSVQRNGDRIRILANLIDGRQERHLWSQTLDGEVDDLFAVEQRMAQAIAQQVNVRLNPEERQRLGRNRRTNPAAMEAYLEGLTNWKLRRTPEAMRLFRQAVTLDPQLAAAWGTLAACYSIGGNTRVRAEAMRMGKEAAGNAIRLEENLPEAHSALGWILTYYDWDWAGAEREFRRAIEVNPSYAQAYHAYSHYLVIFRRSDEADEQIQRARALDPFEPAIAGHMTWHYYMRRNYTRALDEARRALELDPKNPLAQEYRILVYTRLGRYDEAIAEAKSTGNRFAVAAAVAAKGDRVEALKMLDGLLPSANLQNRPRMIFAIYAAMNDREKTFEWLEKALDEHSYALPDIRVDPAYDAYRTDPRFRKALERMGLPPL